MEYQKPMAYVKRVACTDLSLKEFQDQWKELGDAGQATIRKWADDEQRALGVAVPE